MVNVICWIVFNLIIYMLLKRTWSSCTNSTRRTQADSNHQPLKLLEFECSFQFELVHNNSQVKIPLVTPVIKQTNLILAANSSWYSSLETIEINPNRYNSKEPERASFLEHWPGGDQYQHFSCPNTGNVF